MFERIRPDKKKVIRERPEAKIQKGIINTLKLRDWVVMQTHGNMFQKGFPDLYAGHKMHGVRWIEVKLPNMKGSRFTPAQLESFPKLLAIGVGIWILTGSSEMDIKQLFSPPNFIQYYAKSL